MHNIDCHNDFSGPQDCLDIHILIQLVTFDYNTKLETF